METSVHRSHIAGGTGDEFEDREDAPTALSFTRTLMFYGHGACTEENVSACVLLQEARTMRKKYFHQKGCNYGPNIADAASYRFGADGVIKVRVGQGKSKQVRC